MSKQETQALVPLRKEIRALALLTLDDDLASSHERHQIGGGRCVSGISLIVDQHNHRCSSLFTFKPEHPPTTHHTPGTTDAPNLSSSSSATITTPPPPRYVSTTFWTGLPTPQPRKASRSSTKRCGISRFSQASEGSEFRVSSAFPRGSGLCSLRSWVVAPAARRGRGLWATAG